MNAAMTIISMAVILLAGFLMTRITKQLRLPNVTAYIIAGILIGPYCFNLVPAEFVEKSEFLSDIALAFIAFGAGEFFRFDTIKKNGKSVILITLLEALFASLLVFVVTYGVLHLNLAFSVVLSALASATAPASTLMTIRQTGAKGEFVETLLQVVAFDNIVALLSYSVAISIGQHALNGGGLTIFGIILPFISNILVFLLGGVFGLVMKLMIQTKRSTDNRLIIAIALLFGFCGICAIFEISPLLGCMSMGCIYINTTEDENMFRQLGYFSPPILLMFFVRSGMSFDLNALVGSSSSIGNTPLIVIGILYFIARIVG
ncbi:MAG: cation:proton antiporter, partial [Butyrivibrio sp.]|nr:cation:proton antiporter [Butyrivibrio sp.]